MSTLGLVALVLAAVVVAMVIGLRMRARAAAPARPRTVADLVRMREEAAAAAEPVKDPVEEPPADEVVDEAEPDETEPDETEPDETEPDETKADETEADEAVEQDADEPEDEQPSVVEPPPAAVTAPPAADLTTVQVPGLRDPDDPVVDTPWARAARIANGATSVWTPETEPATEEVAEKATVAEEPERPVAGPASPPVAASRAVPEGTAEATLRSSRRRRTPAEMAAEQAAADLALLRTFGFADSSGRLDTEAVVSLAAPHPDNTADEPDAEQSVAFRVVGRNGAGIAGATVTLLDDHGNESTAAVAGDDGRGELKAPHPGSFVLVSTAADHQPGAVAITVADAPTEAEVLLARSASLSGTVYGEDGPVVGARLTLVQDGEVVDTADSGADGAYRIVDLAAGEYGLSVSALDCEPVAVLLDVPDETDVRHDVDLEPAGVPAPQRADGVDDLMIGYR